MSKLNLHGGNIVVKENDKNAYAINYEGGKIIDYALSKGNCVAYANIQIGMDAPYDGIVADESIRKKGPTEKQLEGYDSEDLLDSLNNIFDYIIEKYSKRLVIIQIARGKSACETLNDIRFILKKLIDAKIHYFIKVGYRKKDYFDIELPENEKYVFVNIGMIARLTNIKHIKPGTICNPIKTYDIIKNKKSLEIKKYRSHKDDKNILNHMDIPKVILFGIDDDMPFVTPDVYSEEMITNLINDARNYKK